MLDNYLKAYDEPQTNHQVANFIRNNLKNPFKELIDKENYEIGSSPGKGGWAKVPWLATFNKNITDSAQNGYYLVYLFKENMDGVYLSLNFGTTEFKKKYGKNKLMHAAKNFRLLLKDFEETRNYKPLDLGHRNGEEKGTRAKEYEAGDIFNIYYSKDDLPSDEKLIEDYNLFLRMYEYLYEERGNTIFTDEELENNNITPTTIINLTEEEPQEQSTMSFQKYLEDRNFFFDEKTIENYLLSLKVKPFVILTGNSGTGKTKLSQLFAEYLMGTNYYPIKVTTEKTSWCIQKDGKPSNDAGWTVPNGYESFKDVLPLDNIVGEYEIEINGEAATAKLTFFPQLYYDTSNEKLRNHFKKLYYKEKAEQESAKENKLPKPSKQYVDLFIDYNDIVNVSSKDYIQDNDIILKFRVKSILAETTITCSYDIYKYIPFKRPISCNVLVSGINGQGTFHPKFRFNPTLTDNIREYLNGLLEDAEVRWREENKENIENKWDEKTIKRKWDNVAKEIYIDIKIKNFNFSQDNFTPNLSTIVNIKPEIDDERYKIIPVGANWTENRNILGYYNVLTKDYQHTQSLDLLLCAKKEENLSKPYFLILDEMNLSHVERYFSDFLSAMESNKAIPLHNANKKYEGNVPKELHIPKNVFIIGTVNVDETTYMFSPKVLDRANVLEFKTFDEISISDYIKKIPPTVEFKGDLNYLENVLSDVNLKENILSYIKNEFNKVEYKINVDKNEDNGQKISERKQNVLDEIINTLTIINEDLKGSGFEFGYRTVNEILAFMYVAWKYEYEPSEWNNWRRYLDAQILQKILPKIHGSQMVLGETLDNLLAYCLDLESLDDIPELKYVDNNYPYPDSAKKLMQMKEVLEKQRYVSFIS